MKRFAKHRKIKLGLVLPSIPTYSETFFRNKIKGLLDNNFEITLFVVDTKTQNSIDCKVIGLPNYYINHIFFVFFKSFFQIINNPYKSYNLYLICRKDDKNIFKSIKSVFMNSCFLSQKLDWLHFGFGTLAIDREQVAEAINAKMAVSFRGFDYYVFPKKNVNTYDILFSKKIKFHVLSNGMKKGLIKKQVYDVVKISPAIDVSLFSNLELRKNKILQLTTVARLHWIKGLEYTLQALSLLSYEKIDFCYTIVGDGREKERLEFAVRQLGLTNNVTFTGKLNPKEVQNCLQNTDIYIQYSIEEGFCNAVLEAQSMGILCIVSNADGLTENIIDEKTGFIVPKRNPNLLAKKIMQVVNLDEANKILIRKNAVARVKKEFSVEKQILDFKKFYES